MQKLELQQTVPAKAEEEEVGQRPALRRRRQWRHLKPKPMMQHQRQHQQQP